MKIMNNKHEGMDAQQTRRKERKQAWKEVRKIKHKRKPKEMRNGMQARTKKIQDTEGH